MNNEGGKRDIPVTDYSRRKFNLLCTWGKKYILRNKIVIAERHAGAVYALLLHTAV